MTTALAPRDPVTDHLLTPQNAALLIIDYQPLQVGTITSMDRQLLVDNIVRVARMSKTYGLPIVTTTVNVKSGLNLPMLEQLQALTPGVEPIDRLSINAWEDPAFRNAVSATGRKKLLMTALWTEVCLAFPALDALAEGYEVYPIVDAVGGTTLEAHRAGLDRIVQAGAKPVSWVMVICELQRSWARAETVPDFKDILFGHTHETIGN